MLVGLALPWELLRHLGLSWEQPGQGHGQSWAGSSRLRHRGKGARLPLLRCRGLCCPGAENMVLGLLLWRANLALLSGDAASAQSPRTPL